ncbi:ABC-type Fe3+-hydroxamate transport system, substrate-binding protein [Paenibacillus algorifonticola]|uniref:ABC-type Fe3+-hydroxamate transport system, substrate-binding protein n=1 Tax=Paenibacillus algorifonticola TaxID=684063 RepID=A0A1I2F522_9BACL|nr:helix-turn-helix domain-containing protein [Paenibacillus algorifonticola]SFE99808.1 ABC-type Fe3+-hydroxamate transport system, substrate-binding protein [Paenibacillus algorifonticola]
MLLSSASAGLPQVQHSFYMPVRLRELQQQGLDEKQQEEAAPLYRMLIIWGGEGALYIHNYYHELSRGSVWLSGPSLPELQIEPRTELRGLLLEYSCMPAAGETGAGLEHPAPLQHCPAVILRLASELANVWKQRDPHSPFRVQQLFTELLAELHRELASRQKPASSWLEQAEAYIEQHFSEDITREQMASHAGVSPEHFSRMFRKHTGRTFNAHLTLLRIRSAQQSLLTGTAPDLGTLAQEVGYKEGVYLSRKFKEGIGLSPTAYLRKRKRLVSLNLNHTASLMALGIIPELGVYTSWLEGVRGGLQPGLRQQSERGKNSNSGIGETLSQSQSQSGRFDPYGHTPLTFYEAIAAAKPDVIINYSGAEENRRLLPLAPVIELPFQTMNWRDQFLLIAGIVDRRQQAEEWLVQYDERIYTINRQLDRELGSRGTAIVWEIGPNTAYCFSSSFGRGCQILYEDMGFRPPAPLVEQNISAKGFIETGIEMLAAYPADHIFITGPPTYPDDKKRMQSLFQSASWRELDAVRENRVHMLKETELFCGYDPLSSQAQLRELVSVLAPHHKFA